MPVIHVMDCPEFMAGDNSMLREILHADKPLPPFVTGDPEGKIELRYSLAHATVPAGKTTTPHRLKASEVYYILQGQGCMYIDHEVNAVNTGDTVYIPPNAEQHIANTGGSDLIFLCIVDPAWRREDEEVVAE